jgi:2-amino-4-hydroxy-6-hydroxymethyldihydropteridine diphosphokinase
MTNPIQHATTACLGLGGNVGDVREAFRVAARRLGAAPGVRVVAASSIYRTAAVGPVTQDDFLNAVLVVETTISARALLTLLLEVEREAGRDRTLGPRWGPRPLDLDLLLFGDEIIQEPDLVVPHPRLSERRFVLEPLAEVLPVFILPGTGLTVEQWRQRAASSGDHVARLESRWLSV